MDRGSIRMTLRKRVVYGALWIAVPAMCCLAGCNLIANLGQFDGATAADGAADAGGDGSQSTKGNHDGSMAEDARDGSVDEGASDGSMADASDGSMADASDGPNAEGEADVAPINLIQNPGFELGTSPWYTFTSSTSLALLQVSSQYAHSGTYSGWVSDRTATFQGTAQDLTQTATQGQTYAASAWVLVQNPGDAGTDAGAIQDQPASITVAATCLTDGASNITYLQAGAAAANSSSWTKVSGSFTVPVCTLTALQFYVEGPAVGIDLYVDDVSVVAY
jgi:hypothetical protein